MAAVTKSGSFLRILDPRGSAWRDCGMGDTQAWLLVGLHCGMGNTQAWLLVRLHTSISSAAMRSLPLWLCNSHPVSLPALCPHALTSAISASCLKHSWIILWLSPWQQTYSLSLSFHWVPPKEVTMSVSREGMAHLRSLVHGWWWCTEMVLRWKKKKKWLSSWIREQNSTQ